MKDGLDNMRLREIIDIFPLPAIVYDPYNFKIIHINSMALQLYDYDEDDIENLDLTDLYSPDDLQTLLDAPNLSDTKGAFYGPLRHKKRNGEIILIEMSRRLFNFQGKKIHLLFIKNITDIFPKEKLFEIYKEFYNNSGDSVCVINPELYIIEANEKFFEMLSVDKEKLLNKSILTILRQDSKINLAGAVENKFSSTNKLELYFKNFENYWISCKAIAYPMFDIFNQLSYVILQILPEDEVSLKKDILFEQNFLSELFHEILTPINSIIGFIGELEEVSLNESNNIQEILKIIKINKKNLIDSLNAAIELINVQKEKIKIETASASSELIKKRFFEKYGDEINASNIEIEFIHNYELSFQTDIDKFCMLLFRLMKIRLRIKENCTIKISFEKSGDNWFQIKYIDDDIEALKSFNKTLFEIFFAQSFLGYEKIKISRLEAKVIKELARILNGAFETTPELLHFNYISFKFPLEYGDLEIKNEIAEHELKEFESYYSASIDQEKRNLEGNTIKKKMKINQIKCLYIEDQAESQILFRSQLNDIKELDLAPDFESAFKLLEKKFYDIIIADINLSGEYNGIDALKIIRKIPEFKDTPIIGITAYAAPGDKEKFIKAGFNDFIIKPITRRSALNSFKKFFEIEE